jgi:hypothetical protein
MRYLLLFITISTFSCVEQRESSSTKLVISDKFIQDSILFSPLVADIKTTKLETTKGSLISEIYKIAEYKGNYYFLDKYSASTVSAFDSLGKFLMSYGQKGKGEKGSYVLPMDFCIDKVANQMLVLNSEEHEVHYYDLSTGQFLKTKSYVTPFHDFYKTEDGFVLGGAGKEKRLLFADSNFRVKEKFISFDQRGGSGILNKFFNVNDSLLLFRISYSDTVFRISNHEAVPYLTIDFQDHSFKKEDYQQLTGSQKLRLGEFASDKMTNLAVYAESNSHRIFSFDYKHNRYICIEDKLSEHLKIFRRDKIIDDILHLRDFPTVLGTDKNDYFLFAISSSKLYNATKEITSRKFPKNHFSINLDKLDPMGNPILVRIKFTKF